MNTNLSIATDEQLECMLLEHALDLGPECRPLERLLDERVEVSPDDLAAVIHVFAFGIEGTLNLLAPRA